MKLPDEINKAAASAADRYREDVPSAIDLAFETIRRLTVYRQWSEGLIRQAIQDLIYEHRHRANREMKKNAGEYGRPAKVRVGDSPEVRAAHRSLYNYYIAGSTLGKIKVRDLMMISENEDAIARGHQFRSILARKLAEATRTADPEKTVDQAVNEAKLAKIWREAEEESGTGAGNE